MDPEKEKIEMASVPLSMFDVDPNTSSSRMNDSAANNRMSMVKDDIMCKQIQTQNKL
jgi:hypothetical protein